MFEADVDEKDYRTVFTRTETRIINRSIPVLSPDIRKNAFAHDSMSENVGFMVWIKEREKIEHVE